MVGRDRQIPLRFARADVGADSIARAPHAAPSIGSASLTLVLLIAAVLAPLRARAEASPTWVLVEANAGMSFPTGLADDALGSALRVTLGVGGRPAGLPLRIHGLLSVGHAHFDSLVRKDILRSELSRDLVDVTAGARFTVPLGGGVRVFGEVLGGWGWVGSHVTANTVEEIASEAGGFGLVVGGGVQMRLLRFLALGLRAEWSGVFLPGTMDVASELAGLQPPGDATPWGRASVLATTTFHF